MAVLEVPTAEAFEEGVLRAGEPTVVLFWAGWCGFCRAFRPKFDATIAKYGARFAVVRLDDYDNPLWERYGVNVVPSLAFFRDGQIVMRKDGKLMKGLTEAELVAFLHETLPASPAA